MMKDVLLYGKKVLGTGFNEGKVYINLMVMQDLCQKTCLLRGEFEVGKKISLQPIWKDIELAPDMVKGSHKFRLSAGWEEALSVELAFESVDELVTHLEGKDFLLAKHSAKALRKKLAR